MTPLLSRRMMVAAGLSAGGSILLAPMSAVAARSVLPPWTAGTLDIHHIDTGVGNATFILGPDGTSILVDCGATRGGPPASTPLRPDASRSVGEWVSRYALRHSRAAGRDTLDYIIATHVHPDHVGSPKDGDRVGPGGVVLTGLSEVDAMMPATLVIDRGFPDYPVLPLIDAPFASNHVAWMKQRVAAGRQVEAVRVGSVDQVRPRASGAFQLRLVGGGGRVWTGEGTGSRRLFPPRSHWTAEAAPVENHLSIAFVLRYGSFRYFAGGDLVADTHDGAVPWLDVETPVVRAAGQVNVAAANHHGYYDACSAAFFRELNADAYVIQAWHATHPAMSVLQRLLNDWRGRSRKDVYVTRLSPESLAVNSRFVPRLRSTEGHVVVRVNADGEYTIFVTDSRDEADAITFASVPRRSRRLPA